MKTSTHDWLLPVLVGGTAILGGGLLTALLWPRSAPFPLRDWPLLTDWNAADVEAAARMLASENSSGSTRLHIEQVHTQLRACRAGQSLYDRITAGSGFGLQGERAQGGGPRPVSTAHQATEAFRALAREVLDGKHPSQLPFARKFFEPALQDRLLVIAQRLRQKLQNGAVLTPRERHLLAYRKSAAQVRASWISTGARHVGTVDGVEFYS